MQHRSFHLTSEIGPRPFRFTLAGLLLSMLPFGVACILFSYAVKAYVEFDQLRQSIIDGTRPATTELGIGAAPIALVAVGLIFVVWGVRVLQWSRPRAD